MTTPSFAVPGFSPRGSALGRFIAAAAKEGSGGKGKGQSAGQQRGVKQTSPGGSAAGGTGKGHKSYKPGRFVGKGTKKR